MRKFLITAAVAMLVSTSVHARDKKPECELAINGSGKYCTTEDKMDHSTAASDHGYNTAAFELVCGDFMTVTDPKLRAKLDRMYRDPSSRWRTHFMEGYRYVADRKALADSHQGRRSDNALSCITADGDESDDPRWLRLKPGASDRLSDDLKRANEERVKENTARRCEKTRTWRELEAKAGVPSSFPECNQ